MLDHDSLILTRFELLDIRKWGSANHTSASSLFDGTGRVAPRIAPGAPSEARLTPKGHVALLYLDISMSFCTPRVYLCHNVFYIISRPLSVMYYCITI